MIYSKMRDALLIKLKERGYIPKSPVFFVDGDKECVEWYKPYYFFISVEWAPPTMFGASATDRSYFMVYHGSDHDCFVRRWLRLNEAVELIVNTKGCSKKKHFDDQDNGKTLEELVAAMSKMKNQKPTVMAGSYLAKGKSKAKPKKTKSTEQALKDLAKISDQIHAESQQSDVAAEIKELESKLAELRHMQNCRPRRTAKLMCDLYYYAGPSNMYIDELCTKDEMMEHVADFKSDFNKILKGTIFTEESSGDWCGDIEYWIHKEDENFKYLKIIDE